MFMPKEERMADIFRSVITDGVMLCVQNNEVKKCFVMNVSTQNGLSLI
jgi:hypothetical protein